MTSRRKGAIIIVDYDVTDVIGVDFRFVVFVAGCRLVVMEVRLEEFAPVTLLGRFVNDF